jgi:hypothetical protein
VVLLFSWGYSSLSASSAENQTVKRIIVELMYYTSLYYCGIISLILSLTINRHNVPQIIAKFSESDHMLSAMKYGHKIDKSTILYLIIQFTVFMSILVSVLSYEVYTFCSDVNLSK